MKPPFPDGFELSNVVQPVSLVDSDVALAAVTTSQLLDTPLTAGPQAAPVINTVLADTGAQAAGNYILFILVSAFDTVAGPDIQFQRRDAANAANIWEQRYWTGGATSYFLQTTLRVTLQLNERVRVVNPRAGGAGSNYQANIWLLAS